MGEAYQIRNQEGIYFLTFQIVGWVDLFSRKLYRDIIIESLTYCRKHKSMELYAYVIMSNHMHLIVRSGSANLSALVRDFKKYTSKRILHSIVEINESRREWMDMVFSFYAKHNRRIGKKQVWTHENHAVELIDNDMIDSRIDYIHMNPVRSGIVSAAEDYLYSSAGNYAGLDFLLEIDDC